jgi:hypothetical protein
MGNILSAIANIISFHDNNLRNYASTYSIRINAAGEQLEFYIKDSFANSFTKVKPQKELEYHKVFSYLGNQNNPPDMILQQADAFEVKKIESPYSQLALNSSPPKDRLYRSDTRITVRCRECDGGNWDSKDLFYIIGHVNEGELKYLFFVHGLCYAAEKEVYERVANAVKNGTIQAFVAGNLEMGETTEIGRINRVDPLGITYLRIRGMWGIENPLSVFEDVYTYDESTTFSLAAIMKKEKYDSFSQKDKSTLESIDGLEIEDIEIRDPNNPASRLTAKLIKAGW